MTQQNANESQEPRGEGASFASTLLPSAEHYTRKRLRRRHSLRRRILFYLGIFGPGLIAANAGGIATNSSMGARLHHFAAAGAPPLARPHHSVLYGSIIRTLSSLGCTGRLCTVHFRPVISFHISSNLMLLAAVFGRLQHEIRK